MMGRIMKTIVLGDVKVKEFLDYVVTNCDVSVELNKHAEADITLVSPINITLADVNNVIGGTSITLLRRNGEDVLFSGLICKADIKDNGNSYEVRIVAMSNSISLDMAKNNRSFQDISMTYAELIEEVVCSESNSVVICSKECQKVIGRIFIQYNETDWEFLQRIVSSIGLCISVDVENMNTVIRIGMFELKEEAEFNPVYYTCGISQVYYEHGGADSLCYKPDYFYYDVKSYNNYSLGTTVEFKGEKYKICKKRIYVDSELIIFSYRLGRNGLFSVNQIYNENLAGMAFVGEVIDTEKETLKIHFDMDETQEKEKAYSFEWTPLSGNMMYCMPIIGTSVVVYFANREETSGKAITCIGEKQESISGGKGPSYRAFTTEHKKKMELTEDMVSFSSIDVKNDKYEVKLQDNYGITFDSAHGIYCIAGDELFIDGKAIFVEAVTGMQLIQTGDVVSEESLQDPVADIDLSNNIDFYTQNGVTIVSEEEEELLSAFEDEPEEGVFDWAQLIGNIAVGVGVVLLAAVAVASTAVTFGAAAPFWAIFAAGAIGGGIAVGCLAYSDWSSGNVSETGRYAIKAVTSTVSGALAVVCGPGACTGKFWTYVGKCALTGLWTSGVGNFSEQFLENLVYGDEFDLSECLTSMIVGTIASGLAGSFSYGMTSFSSLFKNFGKISDNKLKRLIWGLANKTPKRTVSFLEELKEKIYKDATPFVSEKAALDWARAHARTIFTVLGGDLNKKIAIETAITESATGGALSNPLSAEIDPMLESIWTIIVSDKSSVDIAEEYIVQYGY